MDSIDTLGKMSSDDATRRSREEELQIQKEARKLERLRRRELATAVKMQQREIKLQAREQRKIERKKLEDDLKAEKKQLRVKLKTEKMAAKDTFITGKRAARKEEDLIEDELLELGENVSKFPSNEMKDENQPHDSNVELRPFPPDKVTLTRLLDGSPWENNIEYADKIVNVWTFVVNFVDVLGVWPITIQELAVSFFQPESCILGEIFVSLLRLLARDMVVARKEEREMFDLEDLRFPGLDKVSVWGFEPDVWCSHLDSLSWPEVLRQFALTVGWGPKLRPIVDTSDSKQVDACDDVIEKLRNGSAAEEAAMQVLGRRGRYNWVGPHGRLPSKLTPGTVKYAAYFVLAIEGPQGLSVPEIAAKIQESGLRDLRTSKNPEATIAGSCAKDVLFAKVGISTYCVKAPYRRDPSEKEALWKEAMDEIVALESDSKVSLEEIHDLDNEGSDDLGGMGEHENAGADEAQNEDDSKQDVNVQPVEAGNQSERIEVKAEDAGGSMTGNGEGDEVMTGVLPVPKLENADAPSIEPKRKAEDISHCRSEGLAEDLDSENKMAVKKQKIPLDEFIPFSLNLEALMADSSPPVQAKDPDSEEKQVLAGAAIEATEVDEKIPEITVEAKEPRPPETEFELDESQPGESWVWALSEGGYDCLSIAERLRALEMLIEAVNECGTVRTYLREKQELFLSFRQQMRTEAMLEQKRHKEKLNAMLTDLDKRYEQQNALQSESHVNAEKQIVALSKAAESEALATLRESALRGEAMLSVRLRPLGQDRQWNTYFCLSPYSVSDSDRTAAQIVVQKNNNGGWWVIQDEKSFDALLEALDVRGVRESNLYASLKCHEPWLKKLIRNRSSQSPSISQDLLLTWMNDWLRWIGFEELEDPISLPAAVHPICTLLQAKIHLFLDSLSPESVDQEQWRAMSSEMKSGVEACSSAADIDKILSDIEAFLVSTGAEKADGSEPRVKKAVHLASLPATYAASSLRLSQLLRLAGRSASPPAAFDQHKNKYRDEELDLSKLVPMELFETNMRRRNRRKNKQISQEEQGAQFDVPAMAEEEFDAVQMETYDQAFTEAEQFFEEEQEAAPVDMDALKAAQPSKKKKRKRVVETGMLPAVELPSPAPKKLPSKKKKSSSQKEVPPPVPVWASSDPEMSVPAVVVRKARSSRRRSSAVASSQ